MDESSADDGGGAFKNSPTGNSISHVPARICDPESNYKCVDIVNISYLYCIYIVCEDKLWTFHTFLVIVFVFIESIEHIL